MEIRELRRLLNALEGADVNEFSLETSDYKVSIKRGQPPAVTQYVPQPAAAAAESRPAAAAETAAVKQSAESGVAAALDPQLAEVSAPIVGTFYAAPAPDTPDYVKVGDKVTRGTVLCIIEAMKLMNEIEAETDGVIAEILVKNEDPVEYGQTLFRIRPA